MTIVSYSEVTTWQTCRREYFYKFSLGLRPVEQSKAITSGNIGHFMLETFYRAISEGMSKEEARKYVQKQASAKYGKPLPPEAIKPWVLVNNYIEELTLKGSSLLVEERFIVPVASVFDLSIGFTPDLMWKHNNGVINVEDYKFVGQSWSKNKLSRYTQLKLYQMFLRDLEYNVSKGVLRFFNTTTGKITLKTYKLEGEEAINLRKEFLLAATEVQEFKERPVAEQREIAVRTFNHYTCNWCPFTFPCTLELEGKDASKTLATQYIANEYGYER